MEKRDFVREYMRESNANVARNQKKVDQGIIHAFTEYLVEIDYTKRYIWMGRPIIQYPTDLIVLQELIWRLKPDLIIETGTAFGGTAVFYASILEALGKGRVITIDNDLRSHNYHALVQHPLAKRIFPLSGDSTSPEIINNLYATINTNRLKTVMVCLDSNHTHDHVLQELKLYGPLVSVGSYMIVFDTAIEFMMKRKPADRPWGPGNNPHTAVKEFIENSLLFVVDKEIEQLAMITAAPGGWLKRINV